MLEETHETADIIQRVAALDIGKAELTCWVRVPSPGKYGRRAQEVRTDQTMTRWLLVMADRLAELGVTRVVMEATSDDGKGVFSLLGAAGFEVWLVPARAARAPARAAQDRHPGCGLAVQAGRAAAAAAQLRATTGHPPVAPPDPLPGGSGGGPDRREAASRAGCRVDAQIKFSVVAPDSFGGSGRAMLAALVAGERDPKRLAQLARTRLRAKLSLLVAAFGGFFTDQHAFLLAKMLARVDGLDADLADLDTKLQELIAGFAGVVDRLDEIPGSARPPRACGSPSSAST